VIELTRKGKQVLALPKGHIDPGESPAEAAVREVREEAGVASEVEQKLGDVKYVYTWGGERRFKVVSFFLCRYRSGSVDDHDYEVDGARWLPLEDAPRRLEYGGEREMARKALEALGDG
jgi:8-oxo-dGTP pyrophosphatase MutT (NUDIX family)